MHVQLKRVNAKHTIHLILPWTKEATKPPNFGYSEAAMCICCLKRENTILKLAICSWAKDEIQTTSIKHSKVKKGC